MLLKREDVNDKKEKMRMGKEAKWKLYQGKPVKKIEIENNF